MCVHRWSGGGREMLWTRGHVCSVLIRHSQCGGGFGHPLTPTGTKETRRALLMSSAAQRSAAGTDNCSALVASRGGVPRGHPVALLCPTTDTTPHHLFFFFFSRLCSTATPTVGHPKPAVRASAASRYN